MKDQADCQTVDFFQSAKRGRGRPVSGQAMTNAERQRAYRQRKKTVTVTKNQSDDIDWKARAHAIYSELDALRDNLVVLERRLDRRGLLVSDLRNENVYLKEQLRVMKGQATKYRNDNQTLRNKIQILEATDIG